MNRHTAPDTYRYTSPECRVAAKERWPEGHSLCPGPKVIRLHDDDAPVQRLACACECHRR